MSQTDYWRFGLFERCVVALFILITGAFLSFLTYNLLIASGVMGPYWQQFLDIINLTYLILAVAIVAGPAVSYVIDRFLLVRFRGRRRGDAR